MVDSADCCIGAKRFDLFGDAVTDVFLQEVRGVGVEDRLVVGEGGFESLALGLAEREVSFPPHDQCG